MPIDPKQINLPELRRQLRRHYDRALASRRSWGTRHAERLRRYHADPTLRPEGHRPEDPRLFLPVTQSVLERTQAQFFSTLYGSPDRVTVLPFGDEDVDKAHMAQRFLRWGLSRTVPFLHSKASVPAIAYTGLQDALLDSVAVRKIYPYEVPWLPPSASAKRVLTRLVQIDLLDQEYLLNEPGAEGLQYPESRYLHQQIPMSWDDVQRLGARKGPDGKPIYTVPKNQDRFRGSDSAAMTEAQRLRREAHDDAMDEDADEWSTMFVEAYERCVLQGQASHGLEVDVVVSWFPEADEDSDIARVIALGEAFPVLDRPLRPFFPLTIWPQAHDWRGMNVPDRLMSMQDEVNRLSEQMILYGEHALLPSFFYNAMVTGEMPSLRDVAAGDGIPVFDLNGLSFVQPRSLNNHFVQLFQFMMTQVERSSLVSDFTLGRQSDRPNAPRTYGGTLALLGESQKGFAPLIQHVAGQESEALSFYFALWQTILGRQDDGRRARVYAPIFDRTDAGVPRPAADSIHPLLGRMGGMAGNGSGPEPQPMNPLAGRVPFLEDLHPREAQDLLSQLFGTKAQPHRFIAREVTREALDGLFDVSIEVDPNVEFARQALLTLAQVLEPKVKYWPKGLRELWRKTYEAFGQKGFDQIWPPEVADMETAIVLLRANSLLQAGQQAGQPSPETAPMEAPPESVAGPGVGGSPPGMPPSAPQAPQPMGAF